MHPISVYINTRQFHGGKEAHDVIFIDREIRVAFVMENYASAERLYEILRDVVVDSYKA